MMQDRNKRKSLLTTFAPTINALVLAFSNPDNISKQSSYYKFENILKQWENDGICRKLVSHWRQSLGEDLSRTDINKIDSPIELHPNECQKPLDKHIYCISSMKSILNIELQRLDWRYTGVYFLHLIGGLMDYSDQIILTAIIYFQQLFDRGLHQYERYHVAVAALLVSAKVNNIRPGIKKISAAVRSVIDVSIHLTISNL